MRRSKIAAMVAYLVLSLPGCNVLREANILSPSLESEMGSSTAESVQREYGVLAAYPIQSYLDKLGERLLDNSDDPSSSDYHFRLLDTDDVNAFAVPGGWVYVTRGLVTRCKDEAVLAGVLGHEIAHVTQRHGGKHVTRNAALAVAAAVAHGFDDEPTIVRQVAGVAAYFGGALVSLKYNRDHESQADTLGVKTAYRSGFDPVGLIHFFQFLEEYSPSSGLGWLSTHPKHDDRAQRLESVITHLEPRDGLIQNSHEFRVFKKYVSRWGT